MGRLLGYARVSTIGQNLESQLDMLTAAGVEERDVFVDRASGAKASRPGLDRLLEYAQGGDTIVVTRLDRIGRSVAHIAKLMVDLDARDVGLRFLTMDVDTRSTFGKMLVHVMAACAEMERSLIVERTTEGLAAAKARGVKFGRRAALTQHQIELAEWAIDGGATVAAVARELGVNRSTLYRHVPTLMKAGSAT